MLEIPLLAEYGSYHRDKRNRIIHEIAVPAIVLAVIALERMVRIGPTDLAFLMIVATSLYYLRIAGSRALIAIVALAVFYWLAYFIAWPVALGLFVVGWIAQFVGHRYEGKNPAFLTNLVHLLVGPLWITAVLQAQLAPQRADS